jgi:hypothetical protein
MNEFSVPIYLLHYESQIITKASQLAIPFELELCLDNARSSMCPVDISNIWRLGVKEFQGYFLDRQTSTNTCSTRDFTVYATFLNVYSDSEK